MKPSVLIRQKECGAFSVQIESPDISLELEASTLPHCYAQLFAVAAEHSFAFRGGMHITVEAPRLKPRQPRRYQSQLPVAARVGVALRHLAHS